MLVIFELQDSSCVSLVRRSPFVMFENKQESFSFIKSKLNFVQYRNIKQIYQKNQATIRRLQLQT